MYIINYLRCICCCDFSASPRILQLLSTIAHPVSSQLVSIPNTTLSVEKFLLQPVNLLAFTPKFGVIVIIFHSNILRLCLYRIRLINFSPCVIFVYSLLMLWTLKLLTWRLWLLGLCLQ